MAVCLGAGCRNGVLARGERIDQLPNARKDADAHVHSLLIIKLILERRFVGDSVVILPERVMAERK